MAASAIQILGVKQAQAKFKALPQLLQDQIADALTLAASAVARQAAALVPVGQGDLKRAIGWKVQANRQRAFIGLELRKFDRGGTNAAHQWPYLYGVWVEQGRHGQPAHPFMRPAAEAERGTFPLRVTAAAQRVEQTLAGSTGLL